MLSEKLPSSPLPRSSGQVRYFKETCSNLIGIDPGWKIYVLFPKNEGF